MDYQHHAGPAVAQNSQSAESFLLPPGAEQSLPQQAQIALRQVDNLKFFLISAPVDWVQDQMIRRFLLPTGEYVSCVLWANLFHITGTDIVRCLAFRFQAFGRPVRNTKKFEEGIFSDLRNLKAGSDASLEEPKSQFLDYLYKNNCIRTQKKQKVFYWYSVPHDRLFLDALERDLKREKAGQDPTTVAVAEPALSFEFDASQSLFDQLTKAQQDSNAAVFSMPQEDYSQSASPVVRATDTMPPPPMMPDSMAHAPQESFNDKSSYSQMTMPGPAMSMNTTAPLNPNTHSAQHPSQAHQQLQQFHQPIFDRNGNPLAMQPQSSQRQNSLPAYYEYSPAPSFVSSQSHQEDYSARGVSYEPITPPQQNVTYSSDSVNYISDGDTGLYHAMPEVQQQCAQNAGGSATQTFNNSMPAYPLNNSYSHIEGSPNYKQRRRRTSSVTSHHSTATGSIVKPAAVPRTLHSVRRPSDLRRSVSASVVPQDESHMQRAASNPPAVYQTMSQYHTPDASRHSTPTATVEGRQQSLPLMSGNGFSPFPSSDSLASSPQDYHGAPGALRRARSVTTSELFSPYSQKQHSCPIPGCGRLFKRLEHLKRHVRTHTQEKPYVCPQCNRAFSRSDNLAQHRRTHDENGSVEASATIMEDPGAEDDGQLDNLDEEELESPEEAFPSMNDSFEQYSMMSNGHNGSMGPPLVPASMMTQSF